MLTDVSVSWVTTVLIGVVLAVLLVLSAMLVARRGRTVTTRFYCPWVRRDVAVQQYVWDGEHTIAVISCSAFADPRAVTCGAPCVSGTEDANLAGVERT